MRNRLLQLLLCLSVASPVAAAPAPAPLAAASTGGSRNSAPRTAVLPTSTDAGVADRLTVFVAHSGRDGAGLAFVHGLRESLRTSTRFSLASSEEQAQVLVIVVSAQPGPGVAPASSTLSAPSASALQPNSLAGAAAAAVAGRASASAVSLAYVANNEWRSLLASGARFVGRDVAEQMGHDTLDELATVLDAYLPTGTR